MVKPTSQWWKSVVPLKEVFKCGVNYKLQDVSRKSSRISEYLSENGWRLRKILRGATAMHTELRMRIRDLKNLVSNINVESRPDEICIDANLATSFLGGFKPLDLDDLRTQLHQAVDFITDYYKHVDSHPVLAQVEPGYLRRILPPTPPGPAAAFDSVLHELRRGVLPGMTHWASPSFFAYFPATNSAASLAGDLVASALNPVAFTWLASPAATELEALVLDWLAHLLRLPQRFHHGGAGRGGGVLLATTSEAMLCTLVAARDAALRRAGGGAGVAALPRLVAYGSDQTHSTFVKACRIAGFDPALVRCVATRPESEFALEPARLREAMEADAAAGLVPAYVCVTVGTTSSTAVDPVGPIAEVASLFGAWVHVDAAYAGSACICPEFRATWTAWSGRTR
uniref:Aromatic-L-amino-acid decarboxylase n=1 Tax=Ananas comosus var. bracteatus TaxID=296719 RepID=A0A6V7QV42_ANACO